MERVSTRLALGLVFLVVGCGNEIDHQLRSRASVHQYPAPVVAGESRETASVALQWSPVENAAGFRVFYGQGNFDGTGADKGKSGEVLTSATSVKLESLEEGAEYQFAVVAFGDHGIDSEKSETIRVTVKEHDPGQLPMPVVSPTPGEVDLGTKISMFCADPQAVIRYTTNGSIPNETSTSYSPTAKPPVAFDTTFKIRAFREGFIPSAVRTAIYTVPGDDPPATPTPTPTPYGTVTPTPTPTGTPDPDTVAEPQFDLESGVYEGTFQVHSSTTTPGATVYYRSSTTGWPLDPICFVSPPYPTNGVTVMANQTKYIKTIACMAGMNPSQIVEGWFASDGSNPTPTPTPTPTPGPVAPPVFNPPGGSYPSPLTITMTSATPDAIIHYTTNGATPTCSSTPWVESGVPITVELPRTIKARACAGVMTPSGVVNATYYKAQVADPVFDPEPGPQPGSWVNILITCPTPGAEVYYTFGHLGNDIPDPVCGGSPGTLMDEDGFDLWLGISIHVVKAIACMEGYSPNMAEGLYYRDI